MKLLLKLLIAAVVMNAAVQAGRAAWRYYEFKDAVEQTVRFAVDESAPQLHAQLLRVAEEHGIVIFPADLVVEKAGDQTTVSALYGEEVELVPRLYRREHLFEFTLEIRPIRPLPVNEINK